LRAVQAAAACLREDGRTSDDAAAAAPLHPMPIAPPARSGRRADDVRIPAPADRRRVRGLSVA
jgi:hypothetical protein